MRPMDRMLRTGAGVAALLVGFAVISPVFLGGRRLSALDLLVLATAVLGLGLLLRWSRSGSTRTLGSVLAIVGLICTALTVGLIWLLVQGLGRPY
jgi:drug/metabolite transporter (DMT)-like permease